MITNERQYKITRSEANKFHKALEDMASDRSDRLDVHPLLIRAEREALESQLQDLNSEIEEYERLKAADVSVIHIDSFDELAEGLIKARIAAGLSQKALADRLALKEQQVQRYESERYSSASFQRLREVAAAIGIRIRNDILMPFSPNNFNGLINKLRQVGIDREFLLTRLLSSTDEARAKGEVAIENEDALSAKAGAVLEKVFGWTQDNIFGTQALAAPRFAAAEARFKMPAGRSQNSTSLYAAYANYLAVIVLRGCRGLPKSETPLNFRMIRNEIIEKRGSFDLRSALHYAWDIGIPVLPLRDPGTFHGACWRYDGRSIIVLKQVSKHKSRWLFDLLHELFHAGQHPEALTLEVIEEDETSADRRTSDEEIAASQFAGDVTLNGRAEELAQICTDAAQGSVQNLKRVVPDIAVRECVNTGDLANYLAFRLSWQGISWWGTAANLQARDEDPWTLARDVFIQRFSFEFDNEIDKQILERALH